MKNLILYTSWNVKNNMGSGTSEAIRQVFQLLKKYSEHSIQMVQSHSNSQNYIFLHFQRLFFNMTSKINHPDGIVFGFDFDGFLFPKNRNFKFVSINAGVLADVIRFEKGFMKIFLSFQSFLEKKALQKADRVIVPSRYARQKVMQYYGIKPEKISVISNAFDERVWLKDFSKLKKIKSKKKLILTVAKLYKRKNVESLIQAFELVKEKIKEVELWVVGCGPELENLKKLSKKLALENDICFWGEISDREKKILYKSADLFCLPTLQEAFGFVFLEAYASRIPVVSTKLTAVPEIVKNDVSGLLTGPEPILLAGQMVKLLANKKLVNFLVKNGSKEVKKYTHQKIYQNFDQLINFLSV